MGGLITIECYVIMGAFSHVLNLLVVVYKVVAEAGLVLAAVLRVVAV